MTTSAAMVGRDPERDRLASILARAAAGEAQLALISGDAGLGKSRLVADAAATVADAFEILTGECHPGDRAVPLAPFVDGIRQRIGGLPAPEARSFLGSACPTLAGFMPEISSICTPGVVMGLEPQQAKSMVFEAIAGLIVRRATIRPVLLLIEDLQWADPTSFDLLGLLARRTTGHRVALVATIRADDRDAILDGNVAGLRRVPALQEIRLQPLDRASTARLVAALMPVPPSAELLADVDRRSGGNPLFIQELAAARRSRDAGGMHEASRVPPDLAGLVLRRVDELGDRDREIVELASAIGNDVSASFVARAGRWTVDEASDGLASAAQAGILDPAAEHGASVPRSWRFHHELTREAMYERLTPSRRRRLHGQVADAMLRDAEPAGAPRIAPATLAGHLHAAGAWRPALEQSRIAADLARRIHATHEAAVNAGRALDAATALDDPAVGLLHLQYAEDLALLGDRVAAERNFRDAEGYAAQHGALDVQQAAVEGLAGLAVSRDYALAERLAREAVELADLLGDERIFARSLNRLGNILVNGMRFSEGRAMHEDALARFRRIGDTSGVAESLDHIAMTHYLGGDVRHARETFRQAAETFEELGESERIASAITSRGLYLAVLDGACETDDGPEAYQADAERGLALARAIGWRAGEAYALAALACASLGAGEIATARLRAVDAAGVAEAIEHRQWVLIARFISGLIDAALGDARSALTSFEAALADAREIGSAQWTDRLAAWVDRGRALDGDRTSRAGLVERAGPGGAPIERIGQRRAIISLAELSLREDPASAAGLLEVLVPASGLGAAELVLIRGEASRLQGQIEGADDDLSRAEAIARDVGPRHLVWRSAAARARLWHGRDRERHARAIGIARHELGVLANSSGESDRSFLLRSAEAQQVIGPRVQAGSGSQVLSGRERQVAEGVARGLRNKEIAAELGISSKTVEMHVANAIAKVQASSRSALAVWVATGARLDG